MHLYKSARELHKAGICNERNVAKKIEQGEIIAIPFIPTRAKVLYVTKDDMVKALIKALWTH